MSCHVCSRGPTSRIRHFCPTCARNCLYDLRVQHATVLLEKQSIGKQIEHATVAGRALKESSDDSSENWSSNKEVDLNILTTQAITNETNRSSARINLLAEHIDSLRLEIENKQVDLSKRRSALAQRRSGADSATYQILDREAATLLSVENNTRRTDHLWHSLHSKTAEDRIFLCREAANLYGLRQKVKKKDGELKEMYTIGGMPITDLRDLNGKYSATLNVKSDH